MRRTVCSAAVLLATVAGGCFANKRAVDYRAKAREQFDKGHFDMAVVDYKKAEDFDKGNRLDGLSAERERAVNAVVRKLLEDAWSKYDRGEFEQAHKQLTAIKNAPELATKQIDAQLVRSISDAAAMDWEEVEQLRKRRFYLRAELLADFLVKPLPPGHAMRARHDALVVSGIAFHLGKMRQLKTTYPNAAAFHYLVARRLGADSDPEGLELIAAVKRIAGDPNALNTAGKAAVDWAAEDQFIQARQVGNAWDPAAIALFGTRYGMNDTRYLDEVWNGTHTLDANAYPPIAALVLPQPDDIAATANSNEPSLDSGPRFKSLQFWYGLGSHDLEKNVAASGGGAAFRFPSKSGKATYEASATFESATLGGSVTGYGADFIITALAKDPIVVGVGIGYLRDHVPGNVVIGGDATATVDITQKSVHIPLIARVPLPGGFMASLEGRLNLLQLAKTKKPLDEEQHFSPLTARIYGPVPFLGDAVPALRALGVEAFATYTKDAPNPASFGGRLVYTSVLDDSKSSGQDLWDKVQKSAFAIQTLAGPTWDFWFALDSSPLTTNDRQHGMGTLFRIPNKDTGSIYEFSLHFESANLGGNVGGWGMDYILMKPIKKLGVLGFGLGYSANSITNGPDMPPVDYKEPEQNSFHSPIVLRVPLGTAAILGAEARLNYLALGGTGDPSLNEKRHFHYVGGRLWIPLPFLGDAVAALNKFHLEGHIGYSPGAPRELNYGGMLIWRPIVTTKF